MIVTPFAAIAFLLGLILLFRGSVTGMFCLFIAATLFGGSAAFILVALGGSSIPPAQFVLMFVALRCLLPGPGQMETLRAAIWQNRFMLMFVLYAVISAFTLPILFANSMSVTPLRPIPGADLFAVLPLRMSGQNVTTAVYMVGTLMAGIAASAAMQRPGAALTFARAGAWIGLTHALLGISGVVLMGTAWDSFLALFRNGYYAQLNQSFDGLVRMNGIWPEPSGFAAYGSAWCVFMIELWLRNVLPRRTGLAGLVLVLALVASTSSTAYVSLAAYGLFAGLRFAMAPWNLPARKQLALLAVALLGTVFVLSLLLLLPGLALHLWKLLNLMTVEKAESTSGIQRAFWAKQGFNAFLGSYGLGIGAGSFRSSSLLTAILGSTGILGSLAFLAHLLRSVQPFTTEFLAMRVPSVDRAVGCAASTAALIMLVPASLAAPSPDPGILWGVMCGAAIALRPLQRARRRQPLCRPAFG